MFAAALFLSITAPLAAQQTPPIAHAMPGEEPVDPYTVDPANTGARPFEGDAMARAFGGQAGIRRIVDRLVDASFADERIGEIFMNQDKVRLKRTLFEHFCQTLNAGCTYSGRDMRTAHRHMGVQQGDMNRLVENLQAAMAAEGVPFAAQNRFLAKLAPLRGQIVER